MFFQYVHKLSKYVIQLIDLISLLRSELKVWYKQKLGLIGVEVNSLTMNDNQENLSNPKAQSLLNVHKRDITSALGEGRTKTP